MCLRSLSQESHQYPLVTGEITESPDGQMTQPRSVGQDRGEEEGSRALSAFLQRSPYDFKTNSTQPRKSGGTWKDPSPEAILDLLKNKQTGVCVCVGGGVEF